MTIPVTKTPSRTVPIAETMTSIGRGFPDKLVIFQIPASSFWWVRYYTQKKIFNFTYTNGHTFVDVLWTTNYKGLNFANQVITKVGEMTSEQISDAQKKQIIGEATFLRGYYHFKLLTLYGQIIIRDELISQETLDKPLSTRSEAWNIIIDDFTTASTMLSETNSIHLETFIKSIQTSSRGILR